MLRSSKHLSSAIAAVLLYFCSSVTVMATPFLSYTALDQGGGSWQYDYSITNDLSNQAIKSFTIDFAYGAYHPDFMQIESQAPGWSSDSIPPWFDATGMHNGTFYFFADPGSEIAPISSLDSLSISFLWLLDDPPLNSDAGVRADGDQAFNYTTIPAGLPEPVPEPGTMLLLGLGLAVLTGFRKMTRTGSDV